MKGLSIAFIIFLGKEEVDKVFRFLKLKLNFVIFCHGFDDGRMFGGARLEDRLFAVLGQAGNNIGGKSFKKRHKTLLLLSGGTHSCRHVHIAQPCSMQEP